MKTGEILKKLRAESGLTLEELGNRLDPPVQKATILRWESGAIRTIKGDYLHQLASIFKVSMNYLLGQETTLLSEVQLWDSITAHFGNDACEFMHDFIELNAEGKRKARSQMCDLWKLYKKGDSI